MKTKMVEAKFKYAWEAMKAFEEGEKLYVVSGFVDGEPVYDTVSNKKTLLGVWDVVFKEEEVSWKEEAKKFATESEHINGFEALHDFFDESYDIEEEDQEFLELCRVILRANGEEVIQGGEDD